MPAILKNIDVWRDVTLVVMSRPMFTLETPPPSWKILNMLGSYGDLGDCGKISASTVFETITDIIRFLNKRPRRKIQAVILQVPR